METYPLGIQTFSDVIEGNYLYVDEIREIYQFLQGKYFLYIRPRRFGKSLMLSTIKAIYKGKKELFKGNTINMRISQKKKQVKKTEDTDLPVYIVVVEFSQPKAKVIKI